MTNLSVKPFFYQIRLLFFRMMLTINRYAVNHSFLISQNVSGLESSLQREFYIGTIPLYRACFRFTEMEDKHRCGREALKDKNISTDSEAFPEDHQKVKLPALSSHVCELPDCSCVESDYLL